MVVRSSNWPAPLAALEAARKLFANWAARSARVIIAPHGDADGLAAGVIVIRALERLGSTPLIALPGKGEHVHTLAMRGRLAAIDADALVVLDMGSRAGPIVEGLPTLVIDHHASPAIPDAAVLVSAAGCEPVAPTGVLAFLLLRPIAPIEDLAWLTVVATFGDLNTAESIAPELDGVAAGIRKSHIARTVSLLNAARRAGDYQPQVALDVLLMARDPSEIARGSVPGVAKLEACRRQVMAELERVKRVPPKLAGNIALIRFSSAAQIHPLVATRWAGRLAPAIVIAANDGYLPGRVNFALRTTGNVDLLAFLRGLGLGAVEGEFANGHPRATGGSIPPHEFARMLSALGYPASIANAPACHAA